MKLMPDNGMPPGEFRRAVFLIAVGDGAPTAGPVIPWRP
jgi:hypothetical protein